MEKKKKKKKQQWVYQSPVNSCSFLLRGSGARGYITQQCKNNTCSGVESDAFCQRWICHARDLECWMPDPHFTLFQSLIRRRWKPLHDTNCSTCALSFTSFSPDLVLFYIRKLLHLICEFKIEASNTSAHHNGALISLTPGWNPRCNICENSTATNQCYSRLRLSIEMAEWITESDLLGPTSARSSGIPFCSDN